MPTDNRSVVITLKLDNGGEQTDTSQQTNTSAAANNSDKNGSAKAIAAFAAVEMVRMATSEVVSCADFFATNELSLRDDYVGQRNKQIALTHINRVASAGATIVSSAAQGAMIGGPVGAIVGAALGTIFVGVSTLRSNFEGETNQKIHLEQMDAQLQFTRSRAGWSLKAASIGEDL